MVSWLRVSHLMPAPWARTTEGRVLRRAIATITNLWYFTLSLLRRAPGTHHLWSGTPSMGWLTSMMTFSQDQEARGGLYREPLFCVKTMFKRLGSWLPVRLGPIIPAARLLINSRSERF